MAAPWGANLLGGGELGRHPETLAFRMLFGGRQPMGWGTTVSYRNHVVAWSSVEKESYSHGHSIIFRIFESLNSHRKTICCASPWEPRGAALRMTQGGIPAKAAYAITGRHVGQSLPARNIRCQYLCWMARPPKARKKKKLGGAPFFLHQRIYGGLFCGKPLRSKSL